MDDRRDLVGLVDAASQAGAALVIEEPDRKAENVAERVDDQLRLDVARHASAIIVGPLVEEVGAHGDHEQENHRNHERVKSLFRRVGRDSAGGPGSAGNLVDEQPGYRVDGLLVDQRLEKIQAGIKK